jgi:hypothetical protein
MSASIGDTLRVRFYERRMKNGRKEKCGRRQAARRAS